MKEIYFILKKDEVYEHLFVTLIKHEWRGLDLNSGEIQKSPIGSQIHLRSLIVDYDLEIFLAGINKGEYGDIFQLKLENKIEIGSSIYYLSYE